MLYFLKWGGDFLIQSHIAVQLQCLILLSILLNLFKAWFDCYFDRQNASKKSSFIRSSALNVVCSVSLLIKCLKAVEVFNPMVCSNRQPVKHSTNIRGTTVKITNFSSYKRKESFLLMAHLTCRSRKNYPCQDERLSFCQGLVVSISGLIEQRRHHLPFSNILQQTSKTFWSNSDNSKENNFLCNFIKYPFYSLPLSVWFSVQITSKFNEKPWLLNQSFCTFNSFMKLAVKTLFQSGGCGLCLQEKQLCVPVYHSLWWIR